MLRRRSGKVITVEGSPIWAGIQYRSDLWSQDGSRADCDSTSPRGPRPKCCATARLLEELRLDRAFRVWSQGFSGAIGKETLGSVADGGNTGELFRALICATAQGFLASSIGIANDGLGVGIAKAPAGKTACRVAERQSPWLRCTSRALAPAFSCPNRAKWPISSHFNLGLKSLL
jgi:hypothetical protein